MHESYPFDTAKGRYHTDIGAGPMVRGKLTEAPLAAPH
jgi:hypothetical protein